MNAPRAEMELLKDAIEKKEEDLKCPICLETAKPPIFMCPNSHIICDACAPKVQTCPQCREKLPTPLKRLFSFFLFLLYSLSFLFAKAPLCWEKCHGDGCPAAEAGGTDWRLDWTGERSSNVTWCLSNSISFFIFNNHLQSKVDETVMKEEDIIIRSRCCAGQFTTYQKVRLCMRMVSFC